MKFFHNFMLFYATRLVRLRIFWTLPNHELLTKSWLICSNIEKNVIRIHLNVGILYNTFSWEGVWGQDNV